MSKLVNRFEKFLSVDLKNVTVVTLMLNDRI